MRHCSRKVTCGRRVAGAIMSLVNARSLLLQCVRSLLVPVPTYSIETMIGRKERSSIRTVQMLNLRGLLGIRRMEKVPNAWIRQLCGMTKGDEKIDEGVLRWFIRVENGE